MDPRTALWNTIKQRPVTAPATATITGLPAGRALSSGRVLIRTSKPRRRVQVDWHVRRARFGETTTGPY